MSEQALTNATLIGTPGVEGIYNFSMPCTNFRSDASKLFFKVWPEDALKYCCEDATQHLYSLRNFTYSRLGARISSRQYFDLGNVEFLSPYWKQYQFWQVPQRQIILEGFRCEYTDLYNLYSRRFWTKVMREGTLTSLWIILIIQFIVVVFVLFKWAIILCLRREHHIRKNMKRWWWTKLNLEDWVSDLAHIALVAMVGNCLVEAVGHSSPIRWRPIIFYNAAVVYAWLTLLSLVSSVLRQLAVSAFDESEDEVKRREYYQVQLEKNYLTQDKPVPKEVLTKLQTNDLALSRISEDWRWQRVFGQLAVLILLGTYLMFVDDESGDAMDNIAALVLAALVVACVWSGGVALVVAGRTFTHIMRHLITRRLPQVPEADEGLLRRIQIEGSRNQISQTFYPGSFRSDRYRYQPSVNQHMSNGHQHTPNGHSNVGRGAPAPARSGIRPPNFGPGIAE